MLHNNSRINSEVFSVTNIPQGMGSVKHSILVIVDDVFNIMSVFSGTSEHFKGVILITFSSAFTKLYECKYVESFIGRYKALLV